MLSARPGPSHDRDWVLGFREGTRLRQWAPPNVQTEPPQERDGEARRGRSAARDVSSAVAYWVSQIARTRSSQP
jgi:hypothetical protein